MTHAACKSGIRAPLILTIATFASALALWVFFSLRVPLNDDQWIHFQPIACNLFPNGMMHRKPFREWCGSKDLIVWGLRLPLRSFIYAGVTQAVLFLPFWKLFQIPVALKIFSGIFWLINSILISRLLLAPWFIVVCVVMASTPIFSQHAVDTGPFTTQLTMLLLSLLLIVRAIFSRSLVAASALAIISALPAFLAFENKAAVVFAIPAALTLFMGAFLRRYNKEEVCRWRFILKMALVVTLFAAVLAPLIWYYVHLNTAAGQPYWRELFSRGRSYSINQIALWRKHAGDLFGTFVLYPSSFFHRVYGFTRIESGNSLLLLGLIELFTASLLVFRRKWGYLILLLLSLVLSVASFCLVTRSVESWAGHHLVYALMIPFFGIAISLAALWPNSRGFVLAIILALLYVQVPTFIKVASARPLDHSDGAKNEILSMVNEPGFAAQHLVVHLSWGAFFQDSLFGPPEQMLTWSDDPKDPGIARLAAESGRKVVYIRLKSDSRSLGVPEQQGWKKLAVSSSGGWELWAE